MKLDNSIYTFKQCDTAFIGLPLISSKTPNPLCKKAPDLLRFALNNKDDFVELKDKCVFDELKISDAGNLNLKKLEKVFNNHNEQKLFFLGGEHTITKFIVNSLLKKHNFELVVFDAHLDVRKNGESNACWLREIIEKMPKKVHLVGQRVYSQEEHHYLKSKGLKINNNLNLKNKKLYISFDIDVLDSIYVPSCSTPEPYGLSMQKISELLRQLFKNNEILGIDFVEFSGKEYDITYSNIATIAMDCLKNLLK